MIDIDYCIQAKLDQLFLAFQSGQISEQEYEGAHAYYTTQYEFHYYWNLKFGDPLN